MGIVAIAEGGSYRVDNYTDTSTIYCLYCDRCGSFSISKRTSLKVAVAVALATLTALLAVADAGDMNWPVQWLACFATQMTLIVCTGLIPIIEIPRCRKCGNTHFAMTNTLDYPAMDSSILDVPYKKRITYHWLDY